MQREGFRAVDDALREQRMILFIAVEQIVIAHHVQRRDELFGMNRPIVLPLRCV